MIELALTGYKKARVWINELPETFYPPGRVMEESLPSSTTRPVSIHKGAVELLVPTGGRCLYGLLGAEFAESALDDLVIRVICSGRDGVRFDDALPVGFDDVRKGLPDEFAPAVIDILTASGYASGRLPSGQLTFGCAAHGLVGSCVAIFGQLAKLVVDLFALRTISPSRDQLVKVFDALALR